MPLSLVRLHHRKDLTYRTVTDAPESSVALSQPEDAHTDRVEAFIGIVRGRTVNGTRGRQSAPAKGRSTETAPARRKPPAGKQTGGARRDAGGSTRTGGKGGGRAAPRAPVPRAAGAANPAAVDAAGALGVAGPSADRRTGRRRRGVDLQPRRRGEGTAPAHPGCGAGGVSCTLGRLGGADCWKLTWSKLTRPVFSSTVMWSSTVSLA